MERSNLYLKLFKMVFGCVSLFAAANEEMLKPYLHQIVNRSMELALSAREPYNYFLLLRALFRSIGGGSHDLLYQEFLPLLPNLLQGLNSLQSGLHRQHMKDLFVELCLTVPVRLSSLLPYLPMLMDPLVSALNGSQTLVSQDQWIQEMSFTRRPGSGCPRQASHREDHYILRNAHVQLIASSGAIQAQVAPSLITPVSSQTIQRPLAEEHLGSWRPLRELPLTPTHQCLCLEWCCTRGNWTVCVCCGMEPGRL
ncbi:hypothetical protein TNCV_4043261 [Trichonephila clavipes]|nr:hypothetical protein TNCV_4043261 [Trichonephila clavipes]